MGSGASLISKEKTIRSDTPSDVGSRLRDEYNSLRNKVCFVSVMNVGFQRNVDM